MVDCRTIFGPYTYFRVQSAGFPDATLASVRNWNESIGKYVLKTLLLTEADGFQYPEEQMITNDVCCYFCKRTMLTVDQFIGLKALEFINNIEGILKYLEKLGFIISPDYFKVEVPF